MTIAEAREKCKILIGRVPRDVFIIAILVLASSASFGLGYLAGIDAGLPACADRPAQAGQGMGSTSSPQGGVSIESSLLVATSSAGQIVASKTGTKYYLSQCAGANRITDANKVWFTSASAAQAAGYTLAANCTSR